MSRKDVAADPWAPQHKGQTMALGIQRTSPMKHPIEQQAPAQDRHRSGPHPALPHHIIAEECPHLIPSALWQYALICT